jgi:hypothetical protein
MFFHLKFVNGFGSVLNAILHEIANPFSWFFEIGLNRLITDITEIQSDGCSLVFIHDEVARAANVVLAWIIFKCAETREGCIKLRILPITF